VSWVIGGARVFFVLECDDYGHVRCVGHHGKRAEALKSLSVQ
jgi:hypothetical protein